MKDQITFTQVPAKPEALITYKDDALCFCVDGVEVYRLTKEGMVYRGQLVEDAGRAYELAMDSWNAVQAHNAHKPITQEH